MAKRNGPHEGSIYQRKSDGRWVGSVHLGYEGGVRQRKAVYGTTRAEVVEKVRNLQEDIRQNRYVHRDEWTVETWMNYWLDEVVPGTIKDSTCDHYRWISTRYIVPRLGEIALTKLTAEDVQSLLTWMRTSTRDSKRAKGKVGLSVSTRRQTHIVLARALGAALKRRHVVDNVARQVDTPRGLPSYLDDAFAHDEALALLGAAKDDQLEALYVLAIGVGMRKGEILALKWSNVDLDGGTLRVVATLSRRPKPEGLVLSSPKTARSERTITLPSGCVEALRRQRARQAETRLLSGPGWSDDDFVFTTPRGTPIDPRNVNRFFDQLCARAKVDRRRFHALRHTYATLMLPEVELIVISAVLGHSNIQVTASTYAKVTSRLTSEAADASDRLFRPGSSVRPTG